MYQSPESSTPEPLSLLEIAAWQFKGLLAPSKPKIIVGIPSLQRGAVWKAGQIELLWDSILRGFPIGALVVCSKISNQGTHSGKHGIGWSDGEVTHHLLDGQQRCNAIALGFVNALKPGADAKSPPATLWIDLAPDLPKGSTRQFLLRVLTAAHPWGYMAQDASAVLNVPEIRKAVERYPNKNRPRVEISWPHVSGAPIPFAWLSDAVFLKGMTGCDLWKNILNQCREFAGREWANSAVKLLEGHLAGSAISKHLVRIESGLVNAKKFTMIALNVPKTAIQEQSLQEENGETAGQDEENRIYNVEHLFQRLNSAGTELRGEELLFSMIKAYWPTIEKSFEAIEDKLGNRYLPMPGSRLAMLAARASLIGLDNHTGLPASFNISKIRELAIAKTDKAETECTLLETYLGLTHEKSGTDVQKSDLHQNLRQIDKWLIFDDSVTGDYGLPPVLRSALAQEAPDVFLLLLHLAQRVRKEGLNDGKIAALRKPILGLATALHWFGDNRAKAVATLYSSHFATAPLSPESFYGILKHCLQAPGKRELLKLLSPIQFDTLIPKPSDSDETLPKWRLWDRIIGSETDLETRATKEQNEWPFLCKAITCKAMLLYAQRALLNSRFSDFDPSQINIQEDKNRPWDYDHILPSATLDSNRGRYREACRAWNNMIGNFRAWPLEENRSRGHDHANKSISSPEDLLDSLIVDQAECDAFSLTWGDVNDAIKSAGFMNAARSRMLRIYSDWFNSLEIGILLGISNTPVIQYRPM